MVKTGTLFAPVNGTCIPLEQVPDPVFAGKVVGDGVAFIYEDDTVCAPCGGVVTLIAETKHAVGLAGDDGAEVMLHIGMDTVNLQGEGFETLVKMGQRVKAGEPLVRLDRDFMKNRNIDLTTPMILLNAGNLDYQLSGFEGSTEKGKTIVARYTVKGQENGTENGGEAMKYGKLCEEIIKHVGGKDNVLGVTHCVTRLRFKLKDEGKANTEALSNTQGVMKVIQTGGQYQVVIGPHVDEVYGDLIKTGGFQAEAPVEEAGEKGGEKQSIISRFLVLMSGIFQPLLSILMASGMIKALLVLSTLTGVLSKESGTYVILQGLGDALFYFLPVAVGWSSAKKFGLKEIYGITLGACLSYPTLAALSSGQALYTLFAGTVFESSVYSEFLGIPVILPGAGYSGSVIPIILIVYFASLVSRFLNNRLPAMIRTFFVPFLTLLIAMPVGFIVIGPAAMLLQGLLGEIIQVIIGLNAGIAGLVLGTFWSVLVMFGLHMPIIMMFNVNISTYGYDIINPLIFSGALASMGSVLGVFLRTKSLQEKNIALPAIFSTFFGVNEPALYGVLIPRKKIMYTCFLSAGVGSMIAGFCGAKLYSFGASGPLGLPCFINPAGIDLGFIGLCAGALVSFFLALGTALVIGDKKDEKAA